ncbi:hypothetical protein RRG08_016870 [Elysia crispata]|uniref:Uncharacterized protein n=1 Tax=Elysia crispata TaxID=231223 RepID=A0AAE1CJ03_9GAST|nr:hypothetical protein RRG08_016870 [Elysia crispata]
MRCYDESPTKVRRPGHSGNLPSRRPQPLVTNLGDTGLCVAVEKVRNGRPSTLHPTGRDLTPLLPLFILLSCGLRSQSRVDATCLMSEAAADTDEPLLFLVSRDWHEREVDTQY